MPPGFISPFVFIDADEIWGTKTGLFVAVGTVVIQRLRNAVAERRFTGFILFDTSLPVIPGGIPMVLYNVLFFKLYSDFAEWIQVAVLAGSAFPKGNVPD